MGPDRTAAGPTTGYVATEWTLKRQSTDLRHAVWHPKHADACSVG